MKKMGRNLIAASLLTAMISIASIATAQETSYEPMVAPMLLEEAKKNQNWKRAFVTGKNEQIVFMNVSPQTNPNNEIGIEVHPFDQAILIVEGSGKAVLNGQTSMVKTGDLIFIPQGTSHNVINLSKMRELKLVSFYSANDIPAEAEYKTKADEPTE